MIELLLQAERALTMGMTDQAERLYWQAVEVDPRNSIAVTGLARVALEHADDRTAYVFARKALAIDPENPAAQRLVARLEEVMTYRGEAIPVLDPAEPMPGVNEEGRPGKPPDAEAAAASAAVDRHPGLLGRILRRSR